MVYRRKTCGLFHLIASCMTLLSSPSSSFHVTPPPVSRATGNANQIYEWRNQKIRYQVSEPTLNDKNDDDAPVAILIHGLFVNSDHWRKTLDGLSKAGYRAYAIDLLGYGYSSKPLIDSPDAISLNGENGRFDGSSPSILKNIKLGTANGGERIADVDLKHPLGSCYNFFTWAEQIADFCDEIVFNGNANDDNNKATLVCNSIGTISALQAITDRPEIFDGVFVVNPNFRELHVAEVAAPALSMPLIRAVQGLLRDKGQGLFDALAKPDTVKQILMEPYAVSEAVDDELVDVLLTPLLSKGAANVVFDTLSYSAGPLPEQQLSDEAFPKKGAPVWVCYGEDDPWTPPQRVEKLLNLDPVERVVRLPKVGHCPHDEAPELVNPLLLEFMERVKNGNSAVGISSDSAATVLNNAGI